MTDDLLDSATQEALRATRYAATLAREAPLLRARTVQTLVGRAGSQAAAARQLGIDESTLSRLIATVKTLGSDQTAPGAQWLGSFEGGSDELREYRSRHSVAASEIAAIMGRGQYQSPEGLWRRKTAADGTRPAPLNAANASWSFNHQPSLAAQFAALHPQYTVALTGHWRSSERQWQRCWPHRVLLPADHTGGGPIPIVSVLTFRSTPKDLGPDWGPDGSDQIPLAHYDHHQWLLDTLGLECGYVTMLSRGSDHRTYRISRDDTHIAALRTGAQAFLAHVASGTVPA